MQEFGRTIGAATNNEAEYRGLLAGLDLALEQGAQDLEVRMDSDLLVSQLKGEYRVRSGNLKPLFDEAKRKLARFERVRLVHIPRALNARAAALANRALDSQRSQE